MSTAPTSQWVPPPAEASYYAIPSPSSTQLTLPLLFSPFLPAPSDPTFGRAALPRSPAEERLRAKYKHWDGTVETGKKGKEWVAYQVWEPKEGSVDRNADLLFVHGINDYGGKYSEHADIFLDAGYRVIVPDLPSHGRSTGVHCHLPDLDVLPDAIYAVLEHVMKTDLSNQPNPDPTSQTRKIFIAGQSLGGFTAASTCLKYGLPTSPEPTPASPSDSPKPVISGGLFLCPMLAIAPESRPAYAVELIARGISKVGGVIGLAAANKGKNSEDPAVEQQFEMDPQTYHGKLRVSTGLGILKAITTLEKTMSQLVVPFSLHHGTGDRVTSYHGSERLHKEAISKDKKLHLYDGYEHILLRKGRDEKDDERRQKVLGDMLAWLEAH